MNNENSGKMKIFWRIFISFVIFTLVMIILLWLFQGVLFENIYSGIKNIEIRNAANEIAGAFKTDTDMTNYMVDMSVEKDVCVMVINSEGGVLYNAHSVVDCIIHKISNDRRNLVKLYDTTMLNGGDYFESFRSDFTVTTSVDESGPSKTSTINVENAKSNVISCKAVPDGNGGYLCIIVNSTVAPVNATVRTLLLILITVTALMLITAVILAVVLSRRISRPITEISDTARLLSQGNYNVVFPTSGDQEIAELGETLNYTTEELAKTDRYRKELLANISHDMRTPLTLISGYGEVMRDIPGENNAENIQIIIDEAERLTALVNDALDISKAESGHMTLSPAPYSITASTAEIVDRYNKLVEKDGFNISFMYDADAVVLGDQVKLTQVTYNLISNAINYSQDVKNIEIRQFIDSAAKTVRLEFTDHGEGISEEDLPNIWDRYYKVDKTHKRASVGTGLGLYIVRTILDLHGAAYGVRSSVGNGSTFWFELPLYTD